MCRNKTESIRQNLRKNHIRKQKFAVLCDFLQKKSFSPLLKAAKILQILAFPQCVGESSRLEVVKNIFRSVFFKEPFYPGYSVLETLREHFAKRSLCIEDKVSDVFPTEEPLFQWDDVSEKNIFLPEICVFSTIPEAELDIACSNCCVKQYNADTLPPKQSSLLLCRGKELENFSCSHLKKFHSIYAFFDKNDARYAGKNSGKIRSQNILCFGGRRCVVPNFHCLDQLAERLPKAFAQV